MPPPSAYTPLESLLFFQSLAALNSRPASFAHISETLRNNAFIRDHADYNADRLTPEALEDLYTTLLRDGVNTEGTDPKGRAEGPSVTNAKKRKITSPRPEALADVSHFSAVPDLVSHLYARYKEFVVRDIRHEEQRFDAIQAEIERIQKEDLEAGPAAVQPSAKQEETSTPADVDVKPAQPPHDVTKPPVGPTPTMAKPPMPQAQNIAQPKPIAPQAAQGQPLQVAEQPLPTCGEKPQPPPQKVPDQPPLPVNGKPSLVPQQRKVEPPSTTVTQEPHPSLPAVSPPQVSPAPIQPSPAGRGPLVSASQHPQGQQTPQVPPTQPFTPYPGKPSHTPTPQPPRAVSTQSATTPHPQQVPKPEVGKPVQTPHPSTVPSTPASAPGRASVQSSGPIGHGPAYGTPAIPAQGGLSESRGVRPPRPSIDSERSVTPWKELTRLSIPASPGSPVRLRREDMSPVSDRAPSPTEPEAPTEGVRPRRGKRRAADEKGQDAQADVDTRASKRAKSDKTAPSTRRKRDPSTTSSRSRRSMVRDEDSPTDLPPHGKVKEEVAITPAAMSEEAEAETPTASGRRGSTAAGRRAGRSRPKRKRSVSEAREPEPTPAEPTQADPSQYVLGARNFPRTGAPIMNDVSSHKVASIFTKPLTERDAPGYRDLIYRPQDLKSIKSAINQGSKALAAASETASTPIADAEVSAAGTASKNAVLMVPKTEDVIPPKGIVNSAQLEKELIRMFANAVMFNPIPERGFGPAFPLTTDSGSRASTQGPDDEGGIIHDTLEMFGDVEKAVTSWRAAETTTDESASKGGLSLRRGSDFNLDGADDAKG